MNVNNGNTRIDQTPGAVQLIDTTTGLTRPALEGIKGYVKGIAVSPNGKMLAMLTARSLQGDGVVQIYDLATGRELRQLTGDSGILTALAFTPDGARLAVAAATHIKLWDVAEGQEIITMPGTAAKMAFSPDGRYLVAVNSNEALIYEATPPAPRIEMPAAMSAPPEPPLSTEVPADPLPKSARAALGHGEAALADKDTAGALLWSIKALRDDPDRAALHRRHIGLLLQSLPPLGGAEPVVPMTPAIAPKLGPGRSVLDSALSPDGQLVAYYWGPSSLQVYNTRSGKEAGPRITFAPDVLDPGNTPVCFTPDNRRVVVCLPRSGKKGERRSYLFRSYDIARGSPTGPDIDFQPPPAKGWSVYTERVMGNGQWLVVEYSKEWHGVWYAWNLATGKELDSGRAVQPRGL